MPTLPDRTLARAATPIDGVLPCWRCDEATDDDGYCSACGAVTIPEREPTPLETAILGIDLGDPLVPFGRVPAGAFDAPARPTAGGCEVHELS